MSDVHPGTGVRIGQESHLPAPFQAGPALTREELLAFAEAHGQRVSPDQLDRWRKRGLIPTPERKGLGRGRGVVAWYPASAGPQLVTVARELTTTRDVDAVRWRLWWRGLDIEERFIREELADAIAGLEALRRQVERIREDDEESAAFERSTRKRLNDATMARVRRRLGKDRFATFAMLILQMVSGGYDGVDADDARIVVHGAALPSLNIDFAQAMQFVSRALDPDQLRAALERTAGGELNAARDELLRLAGPLAERVRENANAVLGGAPGFFIAALISEMATGLPPELVLAWLRVRHHEMFRPFFEVCVTLLRRSPFEWPTNPLPLAPGETS